ncbi:hypothetical protein GC209_12955 [bacterium]|nr:hypothetical protein [bacterium]
MEDRDDLIREFKQMIAVAKRKPVNIGMCLGSSPEETVVKMHRSRSPASLKRVAKSEGETTKAACGTIEIVGREAKFTCDGRPPSGLTRQLKIYFQSLGIPLKFDMNTDDDGEA